MSQHEFPGLSKPVTAEQRAAYDLVKERDALRERAEKAEAERDSALEAYRVLDLQDGRLKEGIREAATIIDRLRLREEWRLRYADEETKARHIVAESWLAAYCPTPTKETNG